MAFAKFASPVRVVEISENRKLGHCSATYASLHSCPESCPHKDNGCYAQMGPTGILTQRMTGTAFRKPDSIARLEAAGILGLTGRFDLRLHVVGDCKTDAASKILSSACADFRDRSRRFRKDDQEAAVWGYTHAWSSVRRSSWFGVSMLASCETAEQVEDANTRGYAAALIVPSFESSKPHQTDGGTLVVPCPYQTTGRQCVDCRLCMKSDKLLEMGLTIAFSAHGSKAESVRKTLKSLEVVA